MSDEQVVPEAPKLALRPKDAAKALGIGQRLLWERTNAGEIPHLRIGGAVLYPVDALRAWLEDEVKRQRKPWHRR